MDVVTRDATIFLDGKPLANARVRLGERRDPIVFGEVDGHGAAPPTAFTYSFTATCDGSGAAEAFAALRPAETPAVRMTAPWGILGDVSIRGWIDSSKLAQSEHGTTATLGMIADEKTLRRALGMAVERAIVNCYERDRVTCRALAAKDPAFNRMAHRMGFSRPGGCYRGERKARKAMRRLLRAAGVTRAI